MRLLFIAMTIVILLVSFGLAQDTIQGMYSYTYGDSESLVDAKQTCRNLAVRDALESYYLFVESTTDVENFQLKDDLIRSITAGNVRDVTIVDQAVDGRTISMTVTGVVNPEEIRSLVEKEIASKPAEEPDDPEVDASSRDEGLLTTFNEYETRFREIEKNLSRKDPKKVVELLQAVDQYLMKKRPKSADAFTKTIYACVVVRNKLLGDVAKLKMYQKDRNRIQALNQRKVINSQTDNLKKAVSRLKSFKKLGAGKQALHELWIARCERTLSVVDDEKRVIKRVRR